MPKGKQTIYISSSDEVNSVDDEEDEEDEEESCTSIRLLEDREDDNFSEEDEEVTESQEFEEESESNQEEFVKSAEASDEDEEYRDWISSEDDNYEGSDRKESKPIDKDHYDKVVNLLRQRNRKLDVLKLEECKAYLRKHELMLSGSKATCIQRILEHWRLKDGNGERLYPKSSFTINCTGDVCKGDVVMFKQRVYEKFNLVSRNGEILGKRTLAGRVVKESYGSAKQQHTFTIEVLWSKGVKPLPLLYPLLVKGRNLYRYKTFRQHWGNEAERSKVLEEKHRRGATARQVRASTKIRNTAGFQRKRACSVSRQQDRIKLPKHSGVTLGKKGRKARVGSNSSNKKCARSSSSVKHSNKKHGTKAPPPLSKPFSKAAKSLQASSYFQNFRDRPHAYLRKRNGLEAPQSGREQSHVPVYYNYSHNAMQAPYTVYASQYVDQRGYLGHPYSASSSSSAHFLGPDAYDRRLSVFHFQGRSQPWPW